MYNPFDFSSKRVLVTGGSRGIGLAIAKAFVQQGALVTVLCRDKSRASSNLSDLKQLTLLEVDCSCEAQVEHFFYSMASMDTTFNHLINNVGIAKAQLACFTDPELIGNLFKTNVTSAFLMTKYIANKQADELESIVNIGSISEHLVQTGNLAYSMSKSALSAFSRQAAIEYADKAIRVNTLIPGLTETEIILDESYKHLRNEFIHQSLLDRLATVDEIARAVMYLCSDAASYVSGASLLVSGGQYLL